MMMAQGQWKQFVRREMENSRICCAMRLVLSNTILFFFLSTVQISATGQRRPVAGAAEQGRMAQHRTAPGS